MSLLFRNWNYYIKILNVELYFLVTRARFGVFFALDAGVQGDCRKPGEKSITTPPTWPHAELSTKRNNCSPGSVLCNGEETRQTYIRPLYPQQPSRRPIIGRSANPRWRMTFDVYAPNVTALRVNSNANRLVYWFKCLHFRHKIGK